MTGNPPVLDSGIHPTTRRHPRWAAVVVSIIALVAAALSGAQPAAATPLSAGQMEASVFSLMNLERSVNHLPALRHNARLNNSAFAHNLTMARYNVMSHQVAGEVGLVSRIHYYGYVWRAAGENIGWNSVMTIQGVWGLQNAMYGERAPNDGHRQNILNRNFVDVGINVYFDYAHGKVWLTEDFGTPA